MPAQGKGLDLLDFYNTQFDRDYLEFNVNIHDLEMNLQTFINRSFENITSTDHALNLLQQIQSILQRDTLKADLEAKYMIIFQNYGLDLDAVQKSYEKNKVKPPPSDCALQRACCCCCCCCQYIGFQRPAHCRLASIMREGMHLPSCTCHAI